MSKGIENFLAKEVLDSVQVPIERALTLPAECYTDDTIFRLEVEKIYKRNWIACLFETEVSKPGDVVPIEICDIPLLAVRDWDNQLRVFHNICAYDGCMVAIDRACDVEKIVAPYHGWTYDFEGKLVDTPFWDGTREGNADFLAHFEVDLVPVACDVFLETVFVNLSEVRISFEDYIAPLLRALNEYDLNKLAANSVDGSLSTDFFSVNANWKTFYENKCLNVLHESFVHAAYAASDEVPRLSGDRARAWIDLIDDHYMALEFRKSDFPETYPPFELPHLGENPDVAPKRVMFGTQYPNFYMSVFPEFVMIGFALPIGPAETKMVYTFLTSASRSDVESHRDQLAMLFELFGEANDEDNRIIEAVQKARHSPVNRQHFYAPFWDKMHYRLNRMILEDLVDADE